MASGSRTIIDLNDKQHPFSHLTIENDKSPFMRLPLEVRLLIYEYAVSVAKAIEPDQVTSRSNKFMHMQDGSARYPRLQRLTVVDLARVCRKIYRDLETYPVFYRVNQFHFEYTTDLHRFLVAITPARRQMIRRISLREYYPGGARGPLQNPAYPSERDYLPMLCECTDLQEFTLAVGGYDPERWGPLETHMPPYLEHLVKTAADFDQKRSLWNLPVFRLRIDFSQAFAIDVHNLPRMGPTPHFLSLLHREPAAGILLRLKRTLELRRQYVLEEHAQGRGWNSMFSAQDRVDAVTAARIDIPGEIRVTQDIANSSAGAVSTRTRARAQRVSKATELGTTLKEKNKYNAEGVAAWEIKTIHDLRWDDEPGIECAVEWTEQRHFDPPHHLPYQPPGSWEKIHAVLTFDAMQNIAAFYLDFIEAARKSDDASSQLNKLRSIPAPKDINKAVDGLFDIWAQGEDRYKKTWKVHVKEWKKLQAKFEKLEGTLQKKTSSTSSRSG